MPRPQFSLNTLLWLTAVVGAFCGGMAWQRRLDKPAYVGSRLFGGAIDSEFQELIMPDGDVWERTVVFPDWKRTGRVRPDQIPETDD